MKRNETAMTSPDGTTEVRFRQGGVWSVVDLKTGKLVQSNNIPWTGTKSSVGSRATATRRANKLNTTFADMLFGIVELRPDASTTQWRSL